MLSIPYDKFDVGAFFSRAVRIWGIFLCLMIFSFTMQAQQPEVAVRFANPQYNCETEEYCLDVEFQSDQEGQELFGMNVRFFYDDLQLELIDFRDFQGGYAPFLPNPAVRNTGSANSGSALFNFLSGHPAEFINGAIILDNPEAPSIILPTNDWSKIFQVCFDVSDPAPDPAGFCPTVVWDLEAPANGGFLLGDDGVVMTVVDQSGRFDSQPAKERVVHHNWSYNGPGRPPFGNPESSVCVNTSCNLHPEILITKTTTTTSFSAVGDIIQYQLILENIGEVPLTTIRLQDENADPGSIAYYLGDDGNGILDIGEAWTYGATHTVTQEDIDAGAVWNTAGAAAMDPDGNPVDDISNEVMVPAVLDPVISLTKNGMLDLGEDGLANPGDLITYTFTVENQGNVTLHDISLQDPLPGLVMATISDNAGDGIQVMAPGAIETATATYPITEEDIVAGVRDNVAKVIGIALPNDLDDPSVIRSVEDEDDHLEPIPVLPVEYCTFTQGYYGNAGGVQYGQTTLDIINGALSSGPLVLGLPGRSLTFEPEAAQCIIDRLPGNGSPQPLPANLGDFSVDAGTCKLGSIGLDKEGRIKNNFLTQTITLMLNTRYDEDLCALPLKAICGITVSDAIFSKLGADATVCDLIACANDVLGGGNSCKLKAGELTDVVGQINERFDECQPLSCSDDLQAGMTILKTNSFEDKDHSGTLSVGDVVTYTYTLTNTGEVSLTNVSVVDDLLGPVNMSSTTVPVNAVSVGQLVYTIQPEDVGTTIVNVATAFSDQTEPETDINELWVPVPPLASLSIEKSTVATEFSAVGETINYIFTIRNTGDVRLDQVQLVDLFVDQLSLSCPATVLEAGERMYCTATHTITQADLDAGEVVNIAAVSGVSPDGALIEAVSNEVIVPAVLPVVATLEVEKQGHLISCDPDRIKAGDYIDYTIVVRNTGKSLIEDIRLEDANADPGSISCSLFSLEPGAYLTCTAIHTLTQEDIDAGRVENTAVAIGYDPSGKRVMDTSDDSALLDNDNPDDPTVTILQGQPSVALIKTSAQSTFSSLGEQIIFQLIVQNTGDLTLTDLIVEDEEVDPGTLDCFAERLAPGEFTTCTAIHTVTQADLDAGQIINIASVNGLAPSGEWVSNQSNEVILEWAEICNNEPSTVDCVSFLYQGQTTLEDGLTELCFEVQVDCKQSLSNIAFDVQGQAVFPLDGALVTGTSGVTYQVLNPTNLPFKKGLKFEVVDGESQNGTAEQFCFTVPTAVAGGLTSLNLAAKVGKKTYKAPVPLDGCTAASPNTLISGRLFADADADACQGETEAGLAGVPVILYDDLMQVISATQTESNGAYQFQGIVPGNYRVGFLNPQTDLEFTLQQAGSCTNIHNSDADDSGYTPVFSLYPGEVIQDLDAGLRPRLAGPCDPADMTRAVDVPQSEIGIRDATEINRSELSKTKSTAVDPELSVNFSATTVKEHKFELLQNVPNPFRERTTIGFYVPQAGKVELRIHDAAGRTLKRLNETLPVGYHQFSIQRSDLPESGLMYYTLITGQHTATRKMVMMD